MSATDQVQFEEIETGGGDGWGFPDDESFARILIFTIVIGILVITFLRYPRMTLFKFGLLIQAVIFRFLGKDMKWSATPDVATFIQAAQSRRENLQKKRLIFIRHGESTWNDTFNRSLNPIKFIPRLVYALMMELTLFITGQCDSWFYDSPLSEEGAEQAEELAHMLENADRNDPDIQALLGLNEHSMVVSSPLRRCLSTAAVGLTASLIPKGNRKLVIIPSLQEISCNPDTLAITPVKTVPVPSWLDKSHDRHPIPGVYAACDVSSYATQKPVKGNGLARLNEFAKWVFTGTDPKIQTIVVSGHSFWFRFFFRTFLPHNTTTNDASLAKTLKICNAGAVALDFYRDSAGNCWVDESSIRVLNGKFVP